MTTPRTRADTPPPGMSAAARVTRAAGPGAVLVRAVLAAVLYCLPFLPAGAGSGGSAAPPAAAAASARATPPAGLTPARPEEAVARVVRVHAPVGDGFGSTCHGSPGHEAAALPPSLAPPLTLPRPDGIPPAAPRPGTAPVRDPSHHTAQAVDRMLLRIQRT
ncbi:hypothetical protein OG786_03295 [Streptomyces sp. NBC_00101]|uniref:hypothetical protein n=1 Tax=Streptomyces sp. NBC_00101 TaxID=2975651 RepID=UPI00324DAF25